MALVELSNVSYTYPTGTKPALDGVDLSVEQGEFVALVGPNDSGKSTLCHTIAGFVPHFFRGDLQGTIRVGGVETKSSALNELVQNVGLVFQNPFNQISGTKYTVYEEIAFGLENLGVAHDEMKARVDEILALNGIRELADRSPYSLSGGQQQRVALTSILVMQPKVLVLDEPTSQMDPAGTREVFGLIRSLTERGMTVVMAEHKIEWIAAFADRVIALYEGKILLDGKPGEVLTSDQLDGKPFGIARYTAAAREARSRSMWESGRPLPVTLDEAAAGFRGGRGE